MLGRLFSFLFYILVAWIVFGLIKAIFNMGRAAGEFNRRAESMKQSVREKSAGKGKDVIELDRDQYKVE